jgi:hypothetical protein
MPAAFTAATHAWRKLFQFRLPNTRPVAPGVHRRARAASAFAESYLLPYVRVALLVHTIRSTNWDAATWLLVRA